MAITPSIVSGDDLYIDIKSKIQSMESTKSDLLDLLNINKGPTNMNIKRRRFFLIQELKVHSKNLLHNIQKEY